MESVEIDKAINMFFSRRCTQLQCLKINRNLHWNLLSEDTMFLLDFQPDWSRVKRAKALHSCLADWLLYFTILNICMVSPFWSLGVVVGRSRGACLGKTVSLYSPRLLAIGSGVAIFASAFWFCLTGNEVHQRNSDQNWARMDPDRQEY